MYRFTALVFAITLFSGVAHAQKPATGGWEAASGWGDPQNQPLSPEGYTYAGVLSIGHKSYRTGNYTEAIVQYEKAKMMAMERPYAYYFIAATQSQLKQYDEAVANLRTAATLAGDIDPAFSAKCIYFMAVVFERAENWEQAKFAWAEYLNSPGAQYFPHNAIAEAHIAGIENKFLLEKQYQIVKDRAGNTTR
ncbi:MAG: hypothetical protein GX146_06680 [Myxococcales bacterium]|nr:hypothetical protein [Myxococcales bacterium]